MASVSPSTPILPLSSSPPLTPDEHRPRRRRRHDRTLPLALKHKNFRHTEPGSSSDEASDVTRPPKHQSRRKIGRNNLRKSISPPGSTGSRSWNWGQSGLIQPEVKDPASFHLKWDNHLSSTMIEIQDLLANEMFVDVTLVCEETVEGRPKHHCLRAHKAILSNCSRYFEQMLRENPCKHPVIVLKDFQRWEVEALLDFMYRGQVMVRPDRVGILLKAADALQIRGLQECIAGSSEWSNWKMKSISGSEILGGPRVLNHKHSHHHDDHNEISGIDGPSSPKLLNLSLSMSNSGSRSPEPPSRRPATTNSRNRRTTPPRPEPQTTANSTTTTGHSAYTNHLTSQHPQPDSSPPYPRRKQARPRRRSGDFVAQDLRITVTPPANHFKEEIEENDNSNQILDFTMGHVQKNHLDSRPEVNNFPPNHFMNMKGWSQREMESPMLKRESPIQPDLDSEGGAMSPVDHYRSSPGTPDSPTLLRGSKVFRGGEGYPMFADHGVSFKLSPPSPSFFMNINNGNPLMGGPHSDSENPETPPSVFSPGGFPLPQMSGGNSSQNQGGQGQPWPGLPLGPAPIFGRHRAQHSAPRGGPPRAWSNADLTEALHNVWNKKMTTSQASRIFGIPYNSLLMYVRGKYGKSLKLDLLKKGLDQAMENSDKAAAAAAAKANNNNNNNTNNRSSPNNPPSTPTNQNNNSLTPNPNNSPQHTANQNHHTNHKSKSISSGSPPVGIGRREGGGGPDRLPPGFNPFSSMGSLFGDYTQPFPFQSSAAAAVALSHILPHHHHPHHHLLGEKVGVMAARRQDIEK